MQELSLLFQSRSELPATIPQLATDGRDEEMITPAQTAVPEFRWLAQPLAFLDLLSERADALHEIVDARD